MPGTLKKKASDSIPYCADQGMTHLAGAAKSGVSIQYLSDWPMPADGVLVFVDEGLVNMDVDKGTYAVIIHNHTDAADEALVAAAAKLAKQLTITNADQDDVLDVLIIGTVDNQLS